MERLTTRNIAGVAVYKHPFECEKCGDEIWRLPDYGNESPTEKLADYEDAEEQGLLLRLPYPLWTEYIYFVDEKDMDVYELDAKKIEVSMMPISKKVLYTVDYFEFLFEDFGKIVFLTRAEAEAKLAEMEGAE
jgi:hypothetical protein